MVWIDNMSDSIIDALTDFQQRFYVRLPQLHPILDLHAGMLLKLYHHYEAYVAGAMIKSSCAFVEVSCLEIRALTKRMPVKKEAKLWPYYVRNLSGERSDNSALGALTHICATQV